MKNKDFKTGDWVYPVDNTYSKNLVTGETENIYLAGSGWSSPQKVKIISEPYKEFVSTIVGGTKEEEFVTVEHNGEAYRVMNNLTDKFDDSLQEEFTWGDDVN